MNARSYKTVFSKRLGTLVAVGEHATSQGKANGAGSGGGAGAGTSATLGYIAALTAGFAFVSLAWAAPANNALPTSGTVVQGAASMAQSANQLNITQSTQRAAINWQSFDIGSQARVQVYQPNAQSVLLNRVVGNTPSQIFGQMQANGHVILVNPNGVLFGKDGSVNAGGFTASTLNISDANFMAGNMVYERNGSTAGIVNEGNITAAPGGYVALLGATVSNEGSIKTQGGSVVMGAGETIKVPVSGTGRIKLELTPAAINASVSNSGSIVTEGGQVYMQALALNRAAAQIIQSGSIDTTGEQGGAVHLLADGGVIKVDGSIVANSRGAGNKGGDIVIGRDEVTGVLAKTTDVSNAKLESNKGFVETSGDYLATDGVAIKAAQWLLDPSDVTISSGTDAGYAQSGTAPALTYTPNASAGTSVVKVDTIQTAINAGTSVTITTTNTGTSGSGAGNITIANALAFANNSDTNATLSLIADNGIIQNTSASITTSAVTGKTGLVGISMETKGNYQGIVAASTSSKGITLNSTISTNGDVKLIGTNSTTNPTVAGGSADIGVNIATGANITGKSIYIEGKANNSFGIQSKSTLMATGDITLKGTSDNWVGVVTNGSITAGGVLTIEGHKTNATGYQGINIASAVKGASVSITGDSKDHYGVGVGAAGSVTSTTGDVTIIGTAVGVNTDAAQNNAVGAQIQGAVTSAKKVTIKGTTTGVRGYQGINIAADVTGESVDITGTSANHRGVDIASGKTVKSTAGNVSITGTSTASDGIDVGNQTVYAPVASIIAAKDIILTGNGVVAGVRTWGDSVLKAGSANVAGNINITGTATTGDGVNFWRYPKAALLTASKDITIAGTANGTSGSGFVSTTSDLNGQAPMINAGGKFTLTGKNTVAANAGVAVNASSGLQVTAAGDIAIKADTQNAAVNAISFYSQTNAVGGNASFKSSSGDVLIQANQGGIIFQNAMPTATLSGTYTSSTEISGRNITIDNTGGNVAVDATTGAATLTAGTGTAKGNAINLASAAGMKLKATQNINLSGKSTDGVGVLLNTGPTNGVEVNATGDVKIVGSTTASNTSQGVALVGASTVTGKNVDITGNAFNGNGVFSNVLVNATGGNASITGTSTGTGSFASALSLWGPVTADQNVTIKGTNTNLSNTSASVFISKAVNATNGKIDVTASTSGATANALQLYTGANLSAKTEVNIKTDTLSIDTSATPATINASGAAGLVTIKTDSAGAQINMGASDAGSATPGSRILGLTNAELNRIAAVNTVIGDIATHTGGITVSAPTAAATATGNITLETKGNIDVKSALAAADNKNLTLKAIGNINVDSTISQGDKGTIVLAAGFGKGAGDGSGGQVKRTTSAGAVTNNSGKTYIYTGEVAGSAKMSDLNSAFGTLYLTTSGVNTQNAQSNTATDLANTISGGANMQVMYREKIAVDLSTPGNSLANAVKTYGDVSQSTVNSDAQTALKAINADKTLSWSQAGNTFNLSSDKLIETFSVNGASYSTAQKLKANLTPYASSSSTYSVTSPQTLPTLTITAKEVTYSGVGVNSKVYDGTTVANLNGTAALASAAVGSSVSTDKSIIDTDKVSLAGTVTGTFANKNVRGTNGTGANTVTLAGASLGGDDASNYNLIQQAPVAANNQITAKDVTYSGVGVNSKVYDGTTTANLNGTAALATVATGSSVATDKSIIAVDASTVSLGGTVTGIFANKNVRGTDGAGVNSVTLSGASLSGADASNYNLVQQAPVTANNKITKANFSVTLSDQTKTYDGSTAATLVPAAFTVKGVTVAGQTESASVNQSVALYNDKNVLGASSVTANLAAGNFAAATGTDLNNYNLPTTVTGKGTITPRPLTIAVGTVADKTADGTTTATVTPGALGNLVTGENLGVSATGNFNDANVGNGKVVTASYTLRNSTNGLASNYILNASTPNPDSRLRGNILASVNPVINPTPSPVNNNTGSRVSAVSGFGGSGAATGVLDDKPVTESREVCSDVFPENCECQPSVIPSIEICFAPKRVAATKEEK